MRAVCAPFQGNSQRQLEVHAADTFAQQADLTPPQDTYAQHSGALQAIQTKQQCYVSVCDQPFRWVVWAHCGTAASELKHLVDAHASPCTSPITIVGLPCQIRLWYCSIGHACKYDQMAGVHGRQRIGSGVQDLSVHLTPYMIACNDHAMAITAGTGRKQFIPGDKISKCCARANASKPKWPLRNNNMQVRHGRLGSCRRLMLQRHWVHHTAQFSCYAG